MTSSQQVGTVLKAGTTRGTVKPFMERGAIIDTYLSFARARARRRRLPFARGLSRSLSTSIEMRPPVDPTHPGHGQPGPGDPAGHGQPAGHVPVTSPGPSTLALVQLSASAAALNAVVPLGLAVQVSLIGRRDVRMQAAFGLVVTTTGLGTTVFNFLVDGVTAKVGRSVGAAAWAEAAGRVRMALLAAMLCGCAACGSLLLAEPHLFALFGAAPEVARHARAYFLFRAGAVPLQCVATAGTGCLGGFNRIHVATGLSLARAALEVIGVAAALIVNHGDEGAAADDACMLGVGMVYVAAVAAHAIAAVVLVLVLAPADAPGRLPIFAGRGRSSAGSNPGGGDRVGARSEVLDFACDGASMLIRSCLLQGSFFGAMTVASRELGPHGLAAHHIVTQLWMVSSYLVDGFATAGTVLGSAMVGEAATAAAAVGVDRSRRSPRRSHEPVRRRRRIFISGSTPGSEPPAVLPALRLLCHRLLVMGLLTGLGFAAGLVLGRDQLIAAFTRDPATADVLRAPAVWRTLAGAQPLNALVFVYDGLIYAFQEFGFVRELMEVGVGFVFLPALAAAAWASPPSLAGVWAAKVGLNVWRAAALGVRIHGWLLTPRGLAKHAAVAASVNVSGGDASSGSEGGGENGFDSSLPDVGGGDGDSDLEAPLLLPASTSMSSR